MMPVGAHVPKTVSPSVIANLPPQVHDAYVQAVAASLHPIFVVAAVVAGFSFVLTLFLREVPLRDTTRGEDLAAEGSVQV